MRRPLAVIGFTYILTLLAASFLAPAVAAALAALFAAGAVGCLFAFRGGQARTAALALGVSAVALAANCVYTAIRYDPAAALASETATVTGTIVELPQRYTNETVYLVQTKTIDTGGGAKQFSTRMRVSFSNALDAKPYDTVTFQAKLSLPPEDNGFGYSSRAYYRSKGVFLFAKPTGSAEVTANPNPPPMYYALRLRQYLTAAVSGPVGGQPGALAAGVLLGDITGLSDTIRQSFTTDGISHILAVSGTQTSLIAQCLLMLLLFLKVPRRLSCGISMGTVALFMAVTGFSPSVSRAGVMSILYLLAMMVGREADALTSLGASVLVLCLINPFAAADTGLLLSFSATFGMIAVSGRINTAAKNAAARFHPSAQKLILMPVGVLSETVGASLLTVPVVAVAFRQVSLVTLPANLVEVPISLLVTLLAAVLTLLTPLRAISFLIPPVAYLTRAACSFMIWFAGLLARLPFASLSSGYGFVGIFLIFLVVMAAVYLLLRKKGGSLAPAVACCCLALSVGVFSYMFASGGVLEIAEMPVGDGSCTVLVQNGKAVVVGLSGYEPDSDVENFLKMRNISRIELLVLPEYSDDTVAAAKQLTAAVPCGAVYCPAGYNGAPISSCTDITAASTASVLQGVSLQLVPDGGALDARVTYGTSSALLPAGKKPDFGAVSRADVLLLNCTVSSADAKKLAPQIVLANSGEAALYASVNFDTQGATVLKTGEDGLLSIRTRGNGKYTIGQG